MSDWEMLVPYLTKGLEECIHKKFENYKSYKHNENGNNKQGIYRRKS